MYEPTDGNNLSKSYKIGPFSMSVIHQMMGCRKPPSKLSVLSFYLPMRRFQLLKCQNDPVNL